MHDIGKGRGDHSVIGAELAVQIGTRLGELWPADIDTLSKIVRYHLLLPDTATRRDLQDPKTIEAVIEQDGDPLLLELLHALAEADSLATGPGVWGDWKSSLIGDLVRRCRLVMAGQELPRPDPIDPLLLLPCTSFRSRIN